MQPPWEYYHEYAHYNRLVLAPFERKEVGVCSLQTSETAIVVDEFMGDKKATGNSFKPFLRVEIATNQQCLFDHT